MRHLKTFDRWIVQFVPLWVVEAIASFGVAAAIVAPFGLILAIVFLDVTMIWSFWPRVMFGILAAWFMLVLRRNRV